ncbi:MAG: hypothetical protein COT89_01325 [Candidatus Colwellbacteria bacterium CG10_big_fil_rev_8_21_14_0_10_42_22]|uniref:Uncharacterized protein n=1 Tax=Candidatus Colwellbacteria bacterium CG10_big_fil_rev_8_21_14_0_10_42_22 TaxID=1974540 RepID=A0A2H0VG20_9BACT|nr:MAG: hypothetical protein COT89_01325 [Candidatus Colwellbacteria bacterium CG10_big_fil_rev_8_21_14_0_10_42_22]
MQYEILRKEASRLRRQGKTYSEIQQMLKTQVPKSTLAYWCKNISLSPQQQERIAKLSSKNLLKARESAITSNKNKRKEYLNSLKNKNKPFTNFIKDEDTAKIALAMLYLGEGSKWSSYRGLSLGSADPDIVKIYLRLLNRCYNIDNTLLRARINYRVDQDLEELIAYWSKIINIPKKNFYKTKPDPRTKGKKTNKGGYKGVCVIIGGGTEIQLELDIIARMSLE